MRGSKTKRLRSEETPKPGRRHGGVTHPIVPTGRIEATPRSRPMPMHLWGPNHRKVKG